MRAWQTELVERYQCTVRASSLSAAAWRCRNAPCAHPEVLRYARRALVRPTGTALHSLAPDTTVHTGSRDYLEFLRHFQSMAQSTRSRNAADNSTHPLLDTLPREPSETFNMLLAPPSSDEIKGVLDAM